MDLLKGAGSEVAAMIAAVASAIAISITALRKRKDVDVNELQTRVGDLTERVTHLETRLDATQDELVQVEWDNFTLRRTLAANGIPDPTREEAS